MSVVKGFLIEKGNKSELVRLIDIVKESSVPLFHEPEGISAYPTYPEIVPKPLDIKTIRGKLIKGTYKNVESFFRDIQLMFENWRAFCLKSLENGAEGGDFD